MKAIIELQVMYSEDLGGYESQIVGINGNFEPLAMADLLKTHRDGIHLTKIYDAVGKEEAVWTVFAELSEVPEEIQYGTGEGDILRLPGYYCLGNVISVEKHPEESGENE